MTACTGLKDPNELPPAKQAQGGNGGVAGSALVAGKGGQNNGHAGFDAGNAGDTQDLGGAGASTVGGNGGSTQVGGNGGKAGNGGRGGSTPMGGNGGVGGEAGMGGEAGVGGGVNDCGSFQPTTGKTLYACDCGAGASAECQVGDDAGAGTLEQPFRTYNRLRVAFSTLSSGDSVAFCRGGSFVAKPQPGETWDSDKCTDTKVPCTIRDYVPSWGNPELPPPRITATGNAFTINVGNAPLGARQIINLSLHGDEVGYAIVATAQFTSLLMCGLELDGFGRGADLHIWEPTQQVVLRDSYAHDIRGPVITTDNGTFRNCGIVRNTFDHVGTTDQPAITLWGTVSDLQVADNTFEHTGQQQPGDLCGSAIAIGDAQHDVTIEHNTFTQDAVDPMSLSMGGADSVEQDADTIEGKISGCQAVNLSGQFGAHGQRAHIARNRVSNYGDEHFRISFCDDCAVENNLLFTDQPIHSTPIAIGVSTAPLVRNNTIYFGANAGSFHNGESSGFYFQGDDQITLTNNLIVNVSSTAQFSCFYGLNSSPTNFTHSDSNGCYYPNVGSGAWSAGNGQLFDWRQATPAGTDQHSFYGDPKLDAERRPTAGSPVIGKGDATSFPKTDLDGISRSNPPDIGAYEHQ